jgi:hypothetical protein
MKRRVRRSNIRAMRMRAHGTSVARSACDNFNLHPVDLNQ